MVGVISGILSVTIFMSVANLFVITALPALFRGHSRSILGMSLPQYVAIGILPSIWSKAQSSVLSFSTSRQTAAMVVARKQPHHSAIGK